MRAFSTVAGLAGLLLGAVLASGPASAQDNDGDLKRESERPTRHFEVPSPADLTDEDAQAIYESIFDELKGGYRVAAYPWAKQYSRWPRYNKTPYRSETHGQRFVNNYANPIAEAYGLYEEAGELPVGSVLAKDAFAVTEEGEVFIGPLFLMEKMPDGFYPASRNWRYTMIMPDGSLFGRTKGAGSERVEFCITCHEAAGDENDHLFFLPEVHRVVEPIN